MIIGTLRVQYMHARLVLAVVAPVCEVSRVDHDPFPQGEMDIAEVVAQGDVSPVWHPRLIAAWLEEMRLHGHELLEVKRCEGEHAGPELTMWRIP